MTNKYFIEFDNIEINMSTTIRISKEQFFDNLNFLHKQVEETTNEEYQLHYINTFFYDYDRFTQTNYVFGLGTATTRLIHQKCKKGYKFCRKGD